MARINDTSNNHGVNQHWTYVLQGLESFRFYNLTITAQNNYHFMSAYARPYVTFVTERKYYVPLGAILNVTLLYLCAMKSANISVRGLTAGF